MQKKTARKRIFELQSSLFFFLQTLPCVQQLFMNKQANMQKKFVVFTHSVHKRVLVGI